MLTRSEQKEQTRERILIVAKDLFEAHGFEATSMRDIAHAADIATGTIAFHFGDKLDLLRAALYEDLEALLAQMLKPSRAALEPWLAGITDQVLKYYESRPALSRVLLKESLFADPPWSSRFAAQFTVLHVAIVERTEAARMNGEFSRQLDGQVFALAYISYYMFGLLAWVQQSHPDPRNLVKELVRHYLTPYRSPKGKTK